MAEEEGTADHPEPDDFRCGSRVVPRQSRSPRHADERHSDDRYDEVPAPADEPIPGPVRSGGCQTRLNGWAGAHLHGAVRPRRPKTGRGRPPRRWC
jgi:hypothetical protein